MKRRVKHKLGGFTLIEILIVLVIISIVSTVAIMSLKANDNRKIQSFSNELGQLMSLVEEQAMLRPAVLGVKITNDHYQFLIFHSDAKMKKGESPWALLEDDKLLGVQDVPDDIALKIVTSDVHEKQADDQADTITPQIVFSTSGDITPFAIYVGAQGKEPRYVIRGEADGTIKTQSLS
jgi:general secretion pathway protein H